MTNTTTPPRVTEQADERIAQYVPGEWFDANTLDEMQAFYLSRLSAIREAAKEHGYAIGLHGSLRRDFDLMAMQWRDDASDKDMLAHAIALAACGIACEGAYKWEQKPNGRFAVSLPICWTDHSNPEFGDKPSLGHIDLSVIEARAGIAGGASPAAADNFAVNFIEQRAADYLRDHASTEHDTGATIWRYGEAGRDYHSSLVELADDLRAAITQQASPEAPASEQEGDAAINTAAREVAARFEAGQDHTEALAKYRRALASPAATTASLGYSKQWCERMAGLESAFDGNIEAGATTASASAIIGAGDPEAFFVEFCERQGYPSDSDMDTVLRAAFYEGIRYCSVNSRAPAPSPEAALAAQPRAELAAGRESIDTPRFRELLDAHSKAAMAVALCEPQTVEDESKARSALIAYIDGHTAGTAGEAVAEGLVHVGTLSVYKDKEATFGHAYDISTNRVGHETLQLLDGAELYASAPSPQSPAGGEGQA